MFVRKAISYLGVKLPYAEAEKRELSKRLVNPTKLTDFTKYEKINRIDGLPSGWVISCQEKLMDKYGFELDAENSIVIFQEEREKAIATFCQNQRAILSLYANLGNGHQNGFLFEERMSERDSGRAYSLFRLPDLEGGYVTDENNNPIQILIATKLYNPYAFFSINRTYILDIISFRRELIDRNKSLLNGMIPGFRIY